MLVFVNGANLNIPKIKIQKAVIKRPIVFANAYPKSRYRLNIKKQEGRLINPRIKKTNHQRKIIAAS